MLFNNTYRVSLKSRAHRFSEASGSRQLKSDLGVGTTRTGRHHERMHINKFIYVLGAEGFGWISRLQTGN